MLTQMATAPAACAPVVADNCVELATETPVAGTPPIETVAPATKFVPAMVTRVPPFVGPDVGPMPVTVGGAAAVQEFRPSP